MSAIRFDLVSKHFGQRVVLDGVSFEVARAGFVSIVGPSGCGKSTLLNLAAGLAQPSSGAVHILGEPLTGINGRATYMFQQDALLPWKTVLDNIVLGLVFRNQTASKARASGMEWLRRVGLDGFADHYPHQLSGGMRKRVALAQSWIVEPEIVLMDEPFSALDIHTRMRMEEEVLALRAASPKTVLFVTHDLEEAIALSDRVLLLAAGPGSRIVGDYAVDLPRPRALLDIRAEPRFSELYRDIWSGLRTEVVRSYAR